MTSLKSIGADSDFVRSAQIRQAIRVAYEKYGATISVEEKRKNLFKYGRNKNVGTSSATLMTLAGSETHETYISDNLIDTISSGNINDSISLFVYGHTIDENGDFTYVKQTVTLNGKNKVTLETPLARVDHISNCDSVDLLGPVYCYQNQTISNGVPQTNNKVHCIIRENQNRSEKGSATLAKDEFWIVTLFTGTILKKQAEFAEVELQVREKGSVFKALDIIGVASGTNIEQQLYPYMIIPANADVRLKAIAGSSATDMATTVHGFLARKTN